MGRKCWNPFCDFVSIRYVHEWRHVGWGDPRFTRRGVTQMHFIQCFGVATRINIDLLFCFLSPYQCHLAFRAYAAYLASCNAYCSCTNSRASRVNEHNLCSVGCRTTTEIRGSDPESELSPRGEREGARRLGEHSSFIIALSGVHKIWWHSRSRGFFLTLWKWDANL